MTNNTGEKRSIKFYLDESVNIVKKDKIYKFLTECQEVQNKLFKYYWDNDNFIHIIDSKDNKDFNRRMLNFREIVPRLKSHHFQQVAQQVFSNLKTIQTTIINKIHFKFEDKEKQKIYNYCKGFCFDWERLVKHIKKQMKAFKKKDVKYYEFLSKLNNIIEDKDLFIPIKQEIETIFWQTKDEKYKCPTKHNFQILCNTCQTVDIEKKEFQWIFVIDSNDRIGGTDKKAFYDKIIIPIKYSNYHKEKLINKKLANTFTLRLNVRKQVEIIAVYNEVIEYPLVNESLDNLGIDIGLKKLITTSEGEVINQNPKIIKKLDKLLSKQSNRERLQEHMQEKLNDEDFRLSDSRYLIQQAKLTEFVLNDNRYKIKSFFINLPYNIVMEDLDIKESKTKSKRVNYLLRRLHIQQIKNDIIKYTKQFGIQVTQINAAFTSQQCSQCGHTSKENRKVQETFCCTKCGFTTNADYNASVNIRERVHNKLINLHTPVWRVKEILKVT